MPGASQLRDHRVVSPHRSPSILVVGTREVGLALVVPPHGPSPLLAELAGAGPLMSVRARFESPEPALFVIGDAATTSIHGQPVPRSHRGLPLLRRCWFAWGLRPWAQAPHPSSTITSDMAADDTVGCDSAIPMGLHPRVG